MPTCSNCGGHVTEAYARVFSPDEATIGVRVCPNCPDKVRTAEGGVRDARSTRRNHDKGTVDHSKSTETTEKSEQSTARADGGHSRWADTNGNPRLKD